MAFELGLAFCRKRVHERAWSCTTCGDKVGASFSSLA
jgi:hypothetical protein